MGSEMCIRDRVYLSFRSTGDFLCERAKVEACLKDINSWMLSNNLMLNNGKTELLVLHSKYRPQPPLDVVVTMLFKLGVKS